MRHEQEHELPNEPENPPVYPPQADADAEGALRGPPQTPSSPMVGAAGASVSGGDQSPLVSAGFPQETDNFGSDETALADEQRRQRARELGLADDATWQEIFYVRDQQERRAVAKELGWIERSETTARMRELGWDPYPSWRTILRIFLDLPVPAAGEQFIARMREISKAIGKDRQASS